MRELRQSIEGIKARLWDRKQTELNTGKENRGCVSCEATANADLSSLNAGHSYSRHSGIIDIFFRTQTAVMTFAITSPRQMTIL